MANNEYTEKQLKVINGEIPFELTNGRFLQWFYKKALCNHDDDLAEKIKCRLDALKSETYERYKQRKRDRYREITQEKNAKLKLPMSGEYTEKQLKVINGEIPFESTNGRFLQWFYKKALSNHDDELAKKIRQRLEKLKSEAYERNLIRSREEKAKFLRNEMPVWRQPKSNEYTAHQIKIVRGEIPYEKVHTKELIHIHLKAHNNGDYELSERLFDLIYARRMRRKENHNTRHKLEDRISLLSKQFDSFVHLDINLPLTNLDKAVLMSNISLGEASAFRINQTIDILKEQGLEGEMVILQGLLMYKNDPNAMLIVMDHWEAIDLIEELLQLPIRRPNTWFVETEKAEKDG